MKKKGQKPPGYDYLKYSGIAFQMIAIIVSFTFAGYWLDGKTSFKIPLFTLLGILLGIALSLYQIFRSLK